MKVCIIGGGISGLCAAYYLSKKGIDISIFEKDSVFGGNCTSYSINGYTVDTGLHYPFYFNEKDALFEIYKDEKNLFVESVTPVINKNYNEYGLFNNRFNPFQTLRLFYYFSLHKLGKFSFEGSLYDILRKAKLDERNIIDWAYAWSYSSWGLSIRNVTAEMFFKSIFSRGISPGGLFKAVINKLSQNRLYSEKYIGGYPKGGIKTIIDILIEENRKMGVNLHISSEVTGIKKLKTDFKVSVAGNDFNFDKVVFTAPIQSLPHLMDLPSEFETKIERAIPWRAITIWLGINKQYFKDKKLHFTDSIFPVIFPISLFDESMAPENHQLISVASGISRKDADKDYAVNKILDAVEYNYPNLLDYETFRHVQFLNLSSTKQGIFDEKFQYNTPIEGLFLAGTNVFEENVGVNWAAHTGRKVAEIIFDHK